MRFVKFNLYNSEPGATHDKIIWVDMDKILWIRPHEQIRWRMENGKRIPAQADMSQYERIPCTALGYGPTLSEDSGEIYVMTPVEEIIG